MIGYKGFDKDFCCRGFQFKVGETYHFDGEIEMCKCGFHFCDTPLAVWDFYPPVNNRFALVEATGNIISDEEVPHKFCTNTLYIIKELSVDELIKIAEEKYVKNQKANTGNCSVATNTGKWSAATNTGDRSVATNTGDRSVATNTGNCSAATNTGDRSVATNTGNWSAATNTGDRSVATNTGDWSVATNTGKWSVATNTGDRSVAVVSGKKSLAVAFGDESRAKGSLGCWIVITEWRDNRPFDVKAFKVDGETIKPDIFYTLKDGVPVEYKEAD